MVMTSGQGGAMKEKITAELEDVIIWSVDLLKLRKPRPVGVEH